MVQRVKHTVQRDPNSSCSPTLGMYIPHTGMYTHKHMLNFPYYRCLALDWYIVTADKPILIHYFGTEVYNLNYGILFVFYSSVDFGRFERYCTHSYSNILVNLLP